LALALAVEAKAVAPAGLAASAAASALTAASNLGASAFNLLRLLGVARRIISLSSALWLGGALLLPAIGSAIYEIGANRQVQAELVGADRGLAEQKTQLRRMLEHARSMRQSRTKSLSKAEAAVELESRSRAQKFIAAYPQARGLFMQIGRTGSLYSFAGFIRSAGLTPEKAERLRNLLASTWLSNLVVSSGKIAAGSGDPTVEELSNALGEQGARDFQSYEQTMQYPYKFATMAAVDAVEIGTPLGASEIDQLAQIIADNSSPYEIKPAGLNSGNLERARNSVDWDAAILEAKAGLSPDKVKAVETLFLELKYPALLDQARKAQTASAAEH
jgi:hypothetical protein